MMTRKIRFGALLAALLITALLPSCQGAAEKARRNIRVEAVEAVDMHALSGADLTLRVRNDTPYKLQLHDAIFDIWFDGTHIGGIQLTEKVEIPRRAVQSVVLRWRIEIDDPLSLFVLARRIKSGNLDQIGISCRIKGRGGPAKVNISQPTIPLSDFLRNFGLSIDDIKTYLGT